MSIINKQKFLTELEKLLTFMYQEDKDTAIAMYEKMFDLADNEDALLTELVSPTRQAVQLARAYDANERKLALANPDEMEDSPSFIIRIKEIFESALDSMPEEEEKEDEPSDFAGKQMWKDDTDLEQGSPEETETETVADAVNTIEEHVNQDTDIFTSQVDEFLKDFKIINPEIMDNGNSGETIVEEKITEPVEEIKDSEPEQAENLTEESVQDTAEEAADKLEADSQKDIKKTPKKQSKSVDKQSNKTKSKKNTQVEAKDNTKLSGGSLVLFLLIAIPLAAIGLIIIFAAAIAVLAASGAAGLMALRILAAAFGSFKVFADVLVVTGTGFVLAAMALLLLWTAIWLAFGLSAKLINGIINLAIKICTKEGSDR